MGQNVSTAVFTGILCLVAGTAIIGGFLWENWKIKWHAWDAGEQRGVWLGAIVALVGLCLAIFGCGGSQPEPTDPVTVEVVRPESDFEPTMSLYLQLSLLRRVVMDCETAQVSAEEGREIEAAARQEMQLLRDEFDAYAHGGQGGPYCGPVCQEIQKFLLEGEGAEILSSCEE